MEQEEQKKMKLIPYWLWAALWAAISVGTSRLLHTSWWLACVTSETGFFLVWLLTRYLWVMKQREKCSRS